MQSLRVRLILLLGAAIVAATLLQFAASLRAATYQADRLFDYHMQQIALALQDSSFQQNNWYTPTDEVATSFEFVIQIWTDDGVRVYQTRSYKTLPEQADSGYSNVVLDNGEWRVFALRTHSRVIQVSQKTSIRRNRAIRLALNSVWPIIPVSLLLLAAAWWVVTSALAPLNRIGRDLAKRTVDSLAPVSDAGVPKEVSLLVAELNSLLSRVTQALQSQQRFVADAAHELRSPLTALRLQVQNLARARDDSARRQGISRLLGGVDRASRLVEQLLLLARQEPSAGAETLAGLSLAACVELAVGDVAPLAAARSIAINIGELRDASINGNAESVRIMVRNLLDNAVRYTPEGKTVRVGLAAAGDKAVLVIEDSGPGIAPENRARVFDRFYRLPGSGASGSGLGLAIVKAVAESHGADIELSGAAQEESGSGLRVAVRFPCIAIGPEPLSPQTVVHEVRHKAV